MALMTKCRTVAIDKTEVDFMVMEYGCRDSSVLVTLGQHCKETHWKISVGIDCQPIDIVVHVDQTVLRTPEVSVTWNGKRVFPTEGTATKTKLREDFKYRAPFRGTIKGLCVKDQFEIRPEHLVTDSWFPATITEQREDCLFKAIAQVPNGKGGFIEVDYPAVKLENIREMAGMKKPVTIPERSIVLQVPAKDPLHTVLSVDDGEHMTHLFGRPSPALGSSGSRHKPKVTFKVSQDRQRVSTDVGASVVEHFLVGDVRFVKQAATKLKHSWTIMIGPFAEHTVVLEKTSMSSKVATVTVDGQLLCEAAAQDIDCAEPHWDCSFRFFGEKALEWEVFQTDVDGNVLATQGTVSNKAKYVHECLVSFLETDKDLTTAKLVIDQRNVMELAEYRPLAHDDPLCCSPDALRGSYGLMVPWMVNDTAPSPLFAHLSGTIGRLADNVNTNVSNVSISAMPDLADGWFMKCCSRPAVGGNDDVVVER